jgi:hypothetical protein
MQNKQKTYRIHSVAFFVVGLLLGLVLWGGTTWADLEASLFDSLIGAGERNNDLACPLIITGNETGQVRLKINNPLTRKVEQAVRFHVSDGSPFDLLEDTRTIPLDPGQTTYADWNIYSEEAAWGHFILVRTYLFASYPVPSRTSTCGVLLINLDPVSGSELTIFAIAASLLSMFIGIGLWAIHNRPLTGKNGWAFRLMLTLGLLTVCGFIFTLFSLWFVAALLFVFTVLAIISGAAFLLQST